jgi:uncharacterized protein (TIGR03435 family)
MTNRSFFRSAAVWLLLTGGAFAQAPAAPAFEVATIKPAPPLDPAKIAAGQLHIGMKTDAGRVDIGFLSLSDLIRVAYKIKPYQLTGPDWLSSARWDIMAKIQDGASADQVPEMLQTLLADRFKLAVHRTNTEHSVYALVVGKNGSKLKEAEPDPPPAAEPDGQPAGPPARGGLVFGSGDSQVRVTPNAGGRGATINSGKFGQMKIGMGEAGMMRMEFSKMKMADLADLLSPFADRPVLDLTELKGSYQVSLDLSMQDMMQVARASGMGAMMGPGPGAPGADASRSPADAASTTTSSIFTAVQQLGLKLDSRKAPVEMIVVDHAEKTPTDN